MSTFDYISYTLVDRVNSAKVKLSKWLGWLTDLLVNLGLILV
jgi:hypothetical protein